MRGEAGRWRKKCFKKWTTPTPFVGETAVFQSMMIVSQEIGEAEEVGRGSDSHRQAKQSPFTGLLKHEL